MLDLSGFDLLVIQIDGLHVGDHVLMAAIGVDGTGSSASVTPGASFPRAGGRNENPARTSAGGG